MDLKRILTHKAQLRRIADDNAGWGDVFLTSVVTVSCFLQGPQKRIVRDQDKELQVSFEMWVTSATSIALGDTVENVTTSTGQTLLGQGRVVRVRRHDHPTLGEIAARALIVRN